MKVKDLIKSLKKYEDYNVKANIFKADNSSWGATLQSFSIDGINDIGHSDKNIILSLKRED